MQRVAIVSKQADACALVKADAEKFGFVYDDERPEVVIAFGGDGTLLHAERAYPEVPKLFLRGSATCKRCDEQPIEDALAAVRKKAFSKEIHEKLEVEISSGGKFARMLALNDIIIRNKNLERAMRFSLSIDDQAIGEHLIGDGLVVATPFGSTAYYKSITKDSFERGFGIAFNNVTTEQLPLLVDETVEITVRILRGPAELAADNDRFSHALEEGDTLIIRKAARPATLLRLG